MRNLSFENRASLSQKSDDLVRIVEELSSSYAKREEFAIKMSHLSSEMRTSEICTGPVFFCAVLTFVAVLNVAVAATVVELGLVFDCDVEVSNGLCEYYNNKSKDNFMNFSNIV